MRLSIFFIYSIFFSFTGMIGMEKSPSLPEGLNKSESNAFLHKAKKSNSEPCITSTRKPCVTSTRRSPIDPTKEDIRKSSLKPRLELTSDAEIKKSSQRQEQKQQNKK